MEFSDTYRLPIKMAVETGLGFLTYGVGFFLQENVYGNPNILAPIEQGLLQGQTSLTSLGALVTVNAMTNAAVTAMETEATTKKSLKRLRQLEYLVPAFWGTVNTLYEIGEVALGDTRVDNHVMDVAAGWVASGIIWGTLWLHNKKNKDRSH